MPPFSVQHTSVALALASTGRTPLLPWVPAALLRLLAHWPLLLAAPVRGGMLPLGGTTGCLP